MEEEVLDGSVLFIVVVVFGNIINDQIIHIHVPIIHQLHNTAECPGDFC